MSDETPRPKNKKDPRVKDHTQKLEKAIEEISQGKSIDGTLVEIEAHTGEHPMPPKKQAEPSVSESLKKAKRRRPGTPDIEPAATMYEPTRPGQVSAGSNMATQHGPTGAGSPSQTPSASGGQGPVAPFGGKIMVGTRVGQIEVTGVLGKGGMGEVFKGYHHALDINVAVKVLPDELSRNELVRQRFLREARLCVKLDHAHIVRVFNVDEYAGNLFLVMEMIEGTDAANMLKNGGRFRYKRALEIGAASADALAYAHTQGLVHRDVKPHNILLGREDGKIKLSDFGLARAATSSSHLTMSGQIMGTPHYMSPEQAEAKEVTDKSDVYSLGVTLYHMLTGETPFVGDTPISVAVQHIAKEILFPEARFTPFPKELVAVLKRMTAKDQAKRCSAKQAAVWLRKLGDMASEDIQAPPELGNSLAPVVRESAAFEAAAKEREAHDENAREAARTMLATVREPKAPTGEYAAQQQHQPGSSQYVVVNTGGGAAKWVALIVLALLIGGGAAWYFALGGQEFVRKQGWIAGGGPGSDTGGTTGGTTGSGSTGGASGGTGGTTGGTGGTVNNGNTPRTDTGGDTGGPLNPPPEKDDPQIAQRLADLNIALGGASTVAELDAARTKLNQIKFDLSSASSSQREEFNRQEARFKRQFALLASNELFKRMDDGVSGYESKKKSDVGAAIESLNLAIVARNEFKRVEVPPEVESEIKDRRDTRLRQVEMATQEIESQLRSDIKELLERENPDYSEAEKKLELLELLRLPADVSGAIRDQKAEVRTLNLLRQARNEIRTGTLKKAKTTLEDIVRRGLPKPLEESYRKAEAELTKAIADTFDGFLGAAQKALTANDYSTARASHEKAESMSKDGLLVTRQTERLAEAKRASDIRECLFKGESALVAMNFNEAVKQLDEADRHIREAGVVAIADELKTQVSSLRTRYDQELEQHFAALLADAKAKLDDKKFPEASKVLVQADDLPLTDEQENRLTTFKQQSQAALGDYVRQLVADIKDALDKGDFERALGLLKESDALSPPDDMVEELKSLHGRFQVEAEKRMKLLLATIQTAIKSKRYSDAQDQLKDAARIPITDEQLVAERTKLDKLWLETLTADVDDRLEKVDEMLDRDDFRQAKTALRSATPLATLDADLRIKLANRNEELARRIEAVFADLLARAADAMKPGTDNFKLADELLAQAGAMGEGEEKLLDQAQTVRWSEAGDARQKAFDDYMVRLFKQLEDLARQGKEAEGNKVVAKIEEWTSTLGPGRQSKLNQLKAELTGERADVRRDRLASKYPRLVKYFDARIIKLEQVMHVDEEIASTYVTHDGKFAAIGTAGGKVYFYNLKRGTSMGSTQGGSRRITAVAFSPDGNGAISGNDDGQLVLYSFGSGTPQPKALGTISDDVSAITYSPDGLRVFALAYDGNVYQYNPVTGASAGGASRTGISRAMAMALSPDGKLLAVGGRDAQVAVFDIPAMTLKKTLQGPGDDLVHRVGFDENSKYLIAGSNGDGVGMWETARLGEKYTQQYKGMGEWARGTGFTPDGRCAAVFDSEIGISLWDRETGIRKHELKFSQLRGDGDEILVTAGCIAPDGTALVATKAGRLFHFTLTSN